MDKESVADYYYMKHSLVKTIDCNEQFIEVKSPNGDEYQIDYHSLWRYYTPVKNLRLAETCTMMLSADYKERFKAEYYQLKNRYIGLKNMVSLWDEGKITFAPTCPREIYDTQLDAMSSYLSVLEKRANIENIILDY